jgi:hypothetical protein
MATAILLIQMAIFTMAVTTGNIKNVLIEESLLLIILRPI